MSPERVAVTPVSDLIDEVLDFIIRDVRGTCVVWDGTIVMFKDAFLTSAIKEAERSATAIETTKSSVVVRDVGSV